MFCEKKQITGAASRPSISAVAYLQPLPKFTDSLPLGNAVALVMRGEGFSMLQEKKTRDKWFEDHLAEWLSKPFEMFQMFKAVKAKVMIHRWTAYHTYVQKETKKRIHQQLIRKKEKS